MWISVGLKRLGSQRSWPQSILISLWNHLVPSPLILTSNLTIFKISKASPSSPPKFEDSETQPSTLVSPKKHRRDNFEMFFGERWWFARSSPCLKTTKSHVETSRYFFETDSFFFCFLKSIGLVLVPWWASLGTVCHFSESKITKQFDEHTGLQGRNWFGLRLPIHKSYKFPKDYQTIGLITKPPTLPPTFFCWWSIEDLLVFSSLPGTESTRRHCP